MFKAVEKFAEVEEPTNKPKTKFKKQEVTIGNFAGMSLEEKIKKLQTLK